jgi:fatty-acid desaturase
MAFINLTSPFILPHFCWFLFYLYWWFSSCLELIFIVLLYLVGFGGVAVTVVHFLLSELYWELSPQKEAAH